MSCHASHARQGPVDDFPRRIDFAKSVRLTPSEHDTETLPESSRLCRFRGPDRSEHPQDSMPVHVVNGGVAELWKGILFEDPQPCRRMRARFPSGHVFLIVPDRCLFKSRKRGLPLLGLFLSQDVTPFGHHLFIHRGLDSCFGQTHRRPPVVMR